MKKKIFLYIIVICLAGISFAAGLQSPTRKSLAVTPFLSFGGHMVFVDFCECSLSYRMFYLPASPLAYFPFGWLGYDPWVVFPPYIPTVVEYFNPLIPQTDHMGMFVPGLQSCRVFHEDFCITLTTHGTIARVAPALIPYPKP